MLEYPYFRLDEQPTIFGVSDWWVTIYFSDDDSHQECFQTKELAEAWIENNKKYGVI